MLRTTGRVITAVSLAIFVGSFILSVAGRIPQDTGLRILAAPLIAAAVGCLILIGRLAWTTDNKGRVTMEATLGVLCLPVGMLSFVAAGADDGIRKYWLIMTLIMFLAFAALIVLTLRVWSAGEQRRNTAWDEQPGMLT